MAVSQPLKKAQIKYKTTKVKRVVLDIPYNNNMEVLTKLEQVPNKTRYIIDLIKNDIQND